MRKYTDLVSLVFRILHLSFGSDLCVISVTARFYTFFRITYSTLIEIFILLANPGE